MSYSRYAFCLGANGPQFPGYRSLAHAEKDAERLALALKAGPCSFTDTDWDVASEPRKALARLSQFVKRQQPLDLLLVHFSGHAILDEELYLLCNETNYDDLITSAIEIDTIKKILSRSPARHKVLILDCCHAGGALREPFKGMQDIKESLDRTFQGSTSAILCACAKRERTRELDTLDSGAGFLSWALTAACTTRFQEVSPDGASLSLKNILSWLPTALEEVNHSLSEKELLTPPEVVIHARGGDGDIWFTDPKKLSLPAKERAEQYDREYRLKAMLADHSGFIHDRLNSFVGRAQELSSIRQRISEKLATGGYITITGQAGQGKSSIIARLVEEYKAEQSAFYFIPLNPGPDHQVSLLRNLMARLILKYNLPDLYVTGESRSTLSDYFPKLLVEVAARGGQEVIFIDGLDQLKTDNNGERDLSFLPTNPPPGIVFVLSTRPNDTLKPLDLLKPHYEYRLPDMSKQDFSLLLQNRQVHLETELIDQLYQAMQANALYLDLVAKRLGESETLQPQEIIEHIADNPENIFSLAMAHLKSPASEWREVIKPILGLLLTAREPLGVRSIRQILGVEDERLREGITRLGGLLADDGKLHYSLFHLKLYDYLRQDQHNQAKEYIFASDEEEGWHQKIAQWCEQADFSLAWHVLKSSSEAEQHVQYTYAYQHYVEHLYYAKDWHKLFALLDAGQYGQAKITYDPSARLYVQDLDLGRQAATGAHYQQGLDLLPFLWRYTLLRCSLTSRADQYPDQAFQLLVQLKHEAKALGLAELLTDPVRKADVLFLIAEQMKMQSDHQTEYRGILERISNIGKTILESNEQARVLYQASELFGQLSEWELAAKTLLWIKDEGRQKEELQELGRLLIEREQWEQARSVVRMIKDSIGQAEALIDLGSVLVKKEQWELASIVYKEAEEAIRPEALQDLEDTSVRADILVEIGLAYATLHQWEQAERIIDSFEESFQRAGALAYYGAIIAAAGKQERARQIWEQSEAIIMAIEEDEQRNQALSFLGNMLIEGEQWEMLEQLLCLLNEEKQHGSEEAELINEQVAESIDEWSEQVIEAPYTSDNARADLAESLAEAQQWELAEHAIVSIASDEKRTEALEKLGEALTKVGQWQQAGRIIRSIEDHEQRLEALGELGEALVKAEQWELAKIIWIEIEEVTKNEILKTVGENDEREDKLADLGETLAGMQQWEQAESLLRALSSSERREEAFVKLVEALTEAQRWEETRRVIDSIESSDSRIEAFETLAEALTKAHLWEEAERIVNSIWDTGKRAEGLAGLGKILFEAREWEKSEQIIHSIENSEKHSESLAELASALAEEKQWEEATRIASCIEDGEKRIEILNKLVQMLVNIEEWDQAERVIQHLESGIGRIAALCMLGTGLAKVVQGERAHKIRVENIWREVENELPTVLSDIQDENERAELLVWLEDNLAQAREWEKAEQVLLSIEGEKARARGQIALGKALVENGQLGLARQTINSIVLDKERAAGLAILGKALIEAKQWSHAEQVIREIEDEEIRAEAAGSLGSALIAMGEWEKAHMIWIQVEDFIRTAQDDEAQQRVLRSWHQMLKNDENDDSVSSNWSDYPAVPARRVAPTHRAYKSRSSLFYRLKDITSRSLQRTSEEERYSPRRVSTSPAPIPPARRARSIYPSRVSSRPYPGARLTRPRYRPGRRRRDTSIRVGTDRPSGGRVREDSWLRATSFCELGAVLVKGKLSEKASVIWKSAGQVCETIKNPLLQTQALSKLAKVFIESRRWEDALSVIETVKRPSERVVLLSELARALAQRSEWELAQTIIKRIEENISTPTDTYWLIISLSVMAKYLTQAGQWETAKSIWEQAKRRIGNDQMLEKPFPQRPTGNTRMLNVPLVRRAPYEYEYVDEYEPVRWPGPIRRRGVTRYPRTDGFEPYDPDEYGEVDEYHNERLKLSESGLSKTGRFLASIGEWELAASVWETLQGSPPSSTMLRAGSPNSQEGWQHRESLKVFLQALIEVEQWTEGEEFINAIVDQDEQGEAVRRLAEALGARGEHEQLLFLVQRWWGRAKTREQAIQLLPLAYELIALKPEIGFAFYEAFDWVDAFVKRL